MDRIRIAFFGPVNSGKSTLVNVICGQEVSLVSDVPGTTTDPIRKTAELPGIGPCVLIDTAGLGDASLLGPERERRTLAILDEADVAVYVTPEDEVSEMRPPISSGVTNDIPIICYKRGQTIESLLQRIAEALPKKEEKYLTGSLVKPGDLVILVMPQDSEAPKGRIILPQVQVIRELLDRGCVPVCCTPESLPKAIESVKPAVVITDSQVFKTVNETIPKDWPLTSFSILLAASKGDIKTYVQGALSIDSLKPGSRVLIAEACTHVPDTEDIGRVKIPALLQKKIANQCKDEMADHVGHDDIVTDSCGIGPVQVDIAAGNDFPEDLSQYDLIIHCGACVASANLVRSRIRKALHAGVPITNYGIALAKLQGILDRIEINK